jgi:hypothetical protein
MSEIILHTREIDGEYQESETNVIVHVHAEDCPIENCSCEPTVRQAAEILI